MFKLLRTLVILIIVYFLVSFIKAFLKSEGEFDYQIEGEILFDVSEDALFYNDLEDNYIFEVKSDEMKNIFKFQINHDFDKKNSIIEDIKYYKDNEFECILPSFKNGLLIDMLCFYEEKLTYYYNLNGISTELDNFAKTYDSNRFNDGESSELIEGVNVFTNNLIDNHYIIFNNYKGIYNVSEDFNTKVYDVSLFNKDIYNQKLSLFYNNFYITADYNSDISFNIFYVFDFVNLKTYEIVSNKDISIDSYIQGVVDSKIYLFDKDAKIQHEIDIEKKEINFLGNLIKYYNYEWQTMTVNQALEELKFNVNEVYTSSGFVKVDKVNGIHYMYKQVDNEYEVYRNINDQLIYLFTTDNVTNINYISNYIYYTNGNHIMYFNDELGVKRVIKYDEFLYNDNIRLHLYER